MLAHDGAGAAFDRAAGRYRVLACDGALANGNGETQEYAVVLTDVTTGQPVDGAAVTVTARRGNAAGAGVPLGPAPAHAWGLALDLSCGVQSFETPAHAWVADNAQRFGWVLPDWARSTGSRPEPWHWEYVVGT